jgi:4'-phosphopantetheinyl transferase EntD
VITPVFSVDPRSPRSHGEYFGALLPTGIAVFETRELAPLETLLADERAAIVSAVPKRAAEYATGRRCARQAMASMGIHGFPLLANSDRSPIWPSEIVGSITHTEGFCAAAAGRRDRFAGIGIDAEITGNLGMELWPTVFTGGEIDWLERLFPRQRAAMATVLFSAKESFYKAQYSLTGAWLEFHSAVVSVEGNTWNLNLIERQGALARPRFPVSGRFVVHGQLVLTAIALEL